VPVRLRVLFLAEGIYAALTAAFGVGSSGGRKKDAMGHGHGGGAGDSRRAAAAAARERFDAGYGSYGAAPQDTYGGQPTGYAGGVAAAPQFSQQQQQQASAYDPYGAAPQGAYAGAGGGGGAHATPPRRGYAAPGDQSGLSDYSGSPYGQQQSAYGAAPPQAQGQGGYGAGVAPSSIPGYGGGKGFDGLLKQAGMRGGKKSD
jgi:hypothetical protein